jgi:hypothetical protein
LNLKVEVFVEAEKLRHFIETVCPKAEPAKTLVVLFALGE